MKMKQPQIAFIIFSLLSHTKRGIMTKQAIKHSKLMFHRRANRKIVLQ